MNGVIATTIPHGCRSVNATFPAPPGAASTGTVSPCIRAPSEALTRSKSGIRFASFVASSSGLPTSSAIVRASSGSCSSSASRRVPQDLASLPRRKRPHHTRAFLRGREGGASVVRARHRNGVHEVAVVWAPDLLFPCSVTPFARDVHLHQASSRGGPKPTWRWTSMPGRHPRDARPRVRDAVDDDEAVEAHAHAAEDAPRLAAARRAGRQIAFGEQHGSDALALVADHGTAVEHQFDGFAALEPMPGLEAH